MKIEPSNSNSAIPVTPIRAVKVVREKSLQKSDNVTSETDKKEPIKLENENVSNSTSNKNGNYKEEELDKQQNTTLKQEKTSEQIKNAVNQLNSRMINSEAQFGIHEETNRVTIKLLDKETKKVIKELPPEKTLDLIAKAWEMAGILIDERR